MKHYRKVLELEAAFAPDRLWRFYGNHDMAWRRPRNVSRFFRTPLGGGGVREGVKLRLVDGESERGVLFLVHGHQGTIDSGNLLVVPFSRLAVRLFWRTLQRALGFPSTSPASDAVLRGRHDRAMASWPAERARGRGERPVLIAGHTHRPVFPGAGPPDLAAEKDRRWNEYDRLDKAEPRDVQAVAQARGEYELARARFERASTYRPPRLDPPSYFNTGCCSFGDGDVTGLELADGEVRLVRWLSDAGQARPEWLDRPVRLTDVFPG